MRFGKHQEIPVMAVVKNNDEWQDLKEKGPEGSLRDIGIIDGGKEIIAEDYVGMEDPVDYMGFTLESAAGLSFNVSADDAAKFTIYSLVEKTDRKGNTTYSLKSLQSSTLKKQKDGSFSIDTKNLLLDDGTYYIGVQSTNAKKGGDADYTISLNESSKFYTLGDNSDDWGNLKTDGASGDVGLLDEISGDDAGEIIHSDWVGFGDSVDYLGFNLSNAAGLSFNVSADDAAKFTIYSLVEKSDRKGNITYSLKSLQSSTLKKQKDGSYSIDTKNLLLDDGTYYIGVQSTNAKKGGDAGYTISLNDSSKFYTLGDNSDDWGNLKTAGASGEVGLLDEISGGDAGKIIYSDWVGFGDSVDYLEFNLSNAAGLSFNVSADDAAKFTIYSLVEKTDRKGNTTYSLKSLQSSTLKKQKDGSYSIDTKNLLLDDGTYYIGVQSTNAKKGGDAGYTISLNDSSKFYTLGDNSDDEVGISIGEVDLSEEILLLDNWVGFGDKVDCRSFTVANDVNAVFSISATDAVKLTVYAKVNGKWKSLKSVSVKANSSNTTSKLALQAGVEYYFSVTSTNAAKGGYAEYSVYGNTFVEKVNLTIGGVDPDRFHIDDCDCGCTVWNDEYGYMDCDELIHYNNLPEKAKYGDITGSPFDDTITFTANQSRYYKNIYLGGGNDRLIFRDSREGDHETDFLSYYSDSDDEYVSDGGIIDMGDGNNSIEIGSENELWTNGIIFGDGNDTITLKKENCLELCDNGISFGGGNDKLLLNDDAEIYWQYSEYVESFGIDFGDGDDYACISNGSEFCVSSSEDHGISFGSGNDRMVVEKNSDFLLFGGTADFGDGNDTLTVDRSSSILCSDDCTLDFGAGFDTLVLDGSLRLAGYNGTEILNVENISGNGYVVFDDETFEQNRDTIEMLEQAGIRLINGADSVYHFSTPERELADNSRTGAVVLDGKDDADDVDIWLCGEEKAQSLDYGFADTTDWVKIVKTDDVESVYGGFFSDIDTDSLTVTLYDSRGQNGVAVDLDESGFSLTDLKNGTYYMRFTVSGSGSVYGYVSMD